MNAILHYESYDKMPVVSFGYWNETLEKWAAEKHIDIKDWQGYMNEGDGGDADRRIMDKLGFDLCWTCRFGGDAYLDPCFDEKILEELPDGQIKKIDRAGAIVIVKPGVVSIPAEVGHTLVDRASYEALYKEKMQFSHARIDYAELEELKNAPPSDLPVGLSCGSLLGNIRNYMGVEGLAYMYCDDPDLFIEILNTQGELCYQNTKHILEKFDGFDFAHYWEDVCFKNGPLIVPQVFDEYIGPHYKRISDLLLSHGIDIVSVDCDGIIDSLIPTWFNNGVNTMFPIEVGTWDASIAPWREKYGKGLRGIGGMNKTVFAQDKKAIDRE